MEQPRGWIATNPKKIIRSVDRLTSTRAGAFGFGCSCSSVLLVNGVRLGAKSFMKE